MATTSMLDASKRILLECSTTVDGIEFLSCDVISTSE